mmetsp:Transcript_35240/g.109575  ORF Transcript_35240/g.109575 Transcript_35240/m.109575 type:complete len:106 (-) Transcript_35240:713-1030(-)
MTPPPPAKACNYPTPQLRPAGTQSRPRGRSAHELLVATAPSVHAERPPAARLATQTAIMITTLAIAHLMKSTLFKKGSSFGSSWGKFNHRPTFESSARLSREPTR